MLVALTGGIAAGKSTVAAMFADCGATVVDADVLAREAVAPDSPGLAAIRQEFGPTVFNASDELDRTALGALVFTSEAARRRLEAIVHPEVMRLSHAAFATARKNNPAGVIVYDVPLLAEAGRADEFDAVVVVEAPDELRLERLRDARGLSTEEARSRLTAQATNGERRALADYLITTDGDLAETKEQVAAVWRALTRPSVD